MFHRVSEWLDGVLETKVVAEDEVILYSIDGMSVINSGKKN